MATDGRQMSRLKYCSSCGALHDFTDKMPLWWLPFDYIDGGYRFVSQVCDECGDALFADAGHLFSFCGKRHDIVKYHWDCGVPPGDDKGGAGAGFRLAVLTRDNLQGAGDEG
jgi:hypothetical protein